MDLLLISELCNKIKETDLYKNLKQAEYELENNKELFPLFSKYQTVQSQYDDAFKMNIDASNYKKELLRVKSLLDKEEVVKNYLECYKNLNSYLDKISKIIFKDVLDETLINNPFLRKDS